MFLFVQMRNSLDRVADQPRRPRPPVHARNRISTPMTNKTQWLVRRQKKHLVYTPTVSHAFAFAPSPTSPTSVCARAHKPTPMNDQRYTTRTCRPNLIFKTKTRQNNMFVQASNSLGQVAVHPRRPRPPVHARNRISTPMTNKTQWSVHMP